MLDWSVNRKIKMLSPQFFKSKGFYKKVNLQLFMKKLPTPIKNKRQNNNLKNKRATSW